MQLSFQLAELGVWYGLFYNWKSYLQPFGHGGAVKSCKEKDDWINQRVTEVIVEQPLASPGSAN